MKFFLLVGMSGWLGVFLPMAVHAGGEEVVVIYNSRVQGSKAVAEYYAKKRGVPKNQVFGFSMSSEESFTRTEFRDDLQKPLWKKLESSKLWRIGPGEIQGTNGSVIQIEYKVLEAKIRYVVLCYGVPLRILHDTTIKEAAEAGMRPELRRNNAAVDTELACLPFQGQKPPLAGPVRNPLYTTTNAAALNPVTGPLMVTRLDGPTPEIARGLVDKALQAETNGLWGRAYFDIRNTTDAGLKVGDDWIRGAAEICRHLGFETIMDTGGDTFPPGFPMSHIAFYAGWYREHVSGPFALPQVEFVPGAFAYHLHSYSAVSLRATDRGWAGPFLAKGVTCTMGCVEEPFLSGTPDVAVFIGRFIFHGFTFGEAAYAGQPILSWQTTVVGDPLYRPFGKSPQVLHQELEQRQSTLVEWSHLRVVDLNLARETPLAEAVSYLEKIETTRTSAVLTEKLADLYASQGKPSSAVATYEQALKLHPTPQQRIRLRLTLGEKLTSLNRNEEAYEDYQTLLAESPAYPDSISIYRKLLTLAQKLGKKDEAAKYNAIVNPTNAPAQ